MKVILSDHRSRLTEDQLKLCVQLSVSKFSPNITELSKEKQGQGVCSFIKKSFFDCIRPHPIKLVNKFVSYPFTIHIVECANQTHKNVWHAKLLTS